METAAEKKIYRKLLSGFDQFKSFQLTTAEHSFISQHGKMSLKDFTEVDSDSTTDRMLATAGSNIMHSLKQ